VYLQLRVPIAAVLKAKRLELVVAGRQLHWVRLQVAPRVARGVLGTVHADEGAEAVVGVEPEGVDSALIRGEGDANMETDISDGPFEAHVVVGKHRGTNQRAVAIPGVLSGAGVLRGCGTICKLRQSLIIRACATRGRV
jgi:hypothetical protein